MGSEMCIRDRVAGMSPALALRDAALLAQAVSAGTTRALALYQAERDILAAQALSIADHIAGFSWSEAELAVLQARLAAVAERLEAELLAHSGEEIFNA